MGEIKVSKPDLFKDAKADWLSKARAEARLLLGHREYITSEDVTARCPLPRYIHRNHIGSVFKHPDFQSVGYTLAKRPSSNSRVIRLWALRETPVPQKSVPRVEYDAGR
jgi:hypothetical protein